MKKNLLAQGDDVEVLLEMSLLLHLFAEVGCDWWRRWVLLWPGPVQGKGPSLSQIA